jgi:Domain of Unknown Function (DUF1259)
LRGVVTVYCLDIEMAWYETRDTSERNSPMGKHLGVVIVGLVLALGLSGVAPASADDAESDTLPVAHIEAIIGAEGHVSDGVLTLTIAREDIGNVKGPRGVTFTPAFEIHGELHFQPLEAGRALLNGDMALRPDEVNPFIAALLTNGLVFQAFHQHLIMLTPPVWFVPILFGTNFAEGRGPGDIQ